MMPMVPSMSWSSIVLLRRLSQRHRPFAVVPVLGGGRTLCTSTTVNDYLGLLPHATTGQQQPHRSARTSANAVVAAIVASTCATLISIGSGTTTSSVSSTTRLQQLQTTIEGVVGENEETDSQSSTTVLNWSGTHAVHVPNDKYWEPSSVAEVEEIVAKCHKAGQAVRPLGSALSPNGIGFHDQGMMSMSNLDAILDINVVEQTVTVQAGARVSQVIEALRKHQLTLPNLASIAEQQMGGFVQVGAHGTGRCIAPVDHYVTKLKLVTPAQGTITLSEEQDAELFHMAKVGLGCLGVVVEVTMKCIPAHLLREHTFVLTRQQAKDQLNTLLTEHQHLRYMWIPYTDAVVCVTNDPVVAEKPKHNSRGTGSWWPDRNKQRQQQQQPLTEQERLRPLIDLLIEVTADSVIAPMTIESVKGMGFAELRDAILSVNPLDVDHVKRCNEAEAAFWRNSEGFKVRPSDELLQFDCGGQQWVWEVCFPTGKQDENNGNDILFMERLLAGIEEQGIPAHSPIEQRWTASSSSFMSPAHGPLDGLHSWVGIINYLPSAETNEPQRRAITDLFQGPYCDLMRKVGSDLNATSHWAKLERPTSLWSLIDLQLFLSTRFPISSFNKCRARLDPKNILANPHINLLLGKPEL